MEKYLFQQLIFREEEKEGYDSPKYLNVRKELAHCRSLKNELCYSFEFTEPLCSLKAG